MRRQFCKRLVCLFVASIFMLTNLVGCSKSKDIPTSETTSEVSGETTDLSVNDLTNTTQKTDVETKTEQASPEEETTLEKSDETSKSESENATSTEGANKETTSKVIETTKKQEQTTKKPVQTTKKPNNKTTEKTTAKPKPVEQTTTAPKVSKAEQMAKDIVDDIITSKMSEFEKALTIHDWLIFNLDYDFTFSNYYVEETLTDRKCVCQGYALTFQLMCKLAGLESIFVSGTGYSSGEWGGHAWNQVRIDGVWYNVDVTWDDPASPGKDFNNHAGNRHDYFLISDARINKDHKATSSGRQNCSKDYDRVAIVKAATNNVYHSNCGFATNVEEMAAAINKLVEANKSEIYIKYYDPKLTLDNMWNGIWDKLKMAKYPIVSVSAYAPVDGIVTYVLSVIPLKEWNKITVITSEQQLNELMDTTYDSGKTTLTVRYEPVDGEVWFGSEKYIFSQNGRVEYNGGKAIYTTIEIMGLQTMP